MWLERSLCGLIEYMRDKEVRRGQIRSGRVIEEKVGRWSTVEVDCTRLVD